MSLQPPTSLSRRAAVVSVSAALAPWIAILAVAGGCRGERTEASAAAPSAATADACAELESRVARLETELELRRQDLERADFELLDARNELARLRALVGRHGQPAGTAEEFEEGGDIAEEEAAAAAVLETPPAAVAPAPRRQPMPGVRVLGAPHVTTGFGGSVIVSGDVVNDGVSTENGVLVVTLSGPEGVLATSEEVMVIAPGARQRYDITFSGILPTGPISASARWSY